MDDANQGTPNSTATGAQLLAALTFLTTATHHTQTQLDELVANFSQPGDDEFDSGPPSPST